MKIIIDLENGFASFKTGKFENGEYNAEVNANLGNISYSFIRSSSELSFFNSGIKIASGKISDITVNDEQLTTDNINELLKSLFKLGNESTGDISLPIDVSDVSGLQDSLSDIQNRISQVNITEVSHSVSNTKYQTGVVTPVDNSTGEQLVTGSELLAHATHDENMFNSMVSQIQAGTFTPEQIQTIVDAAITAAGDDVVTISALQSAINSNNTVTSSLLETEDYSMEFIKQMDGVLLAIGWIQNAGESKQVIFPEGFYFLNNTYGASASYSGLDDQDNNVMHLHKIQLSTNSIIFKASRFGFGLIVGLPVEDNGKYSITLIGKWK